MSPNRNLNVEEDTRSKVPENAKNRLLGKHRELPQVAFTMLYDEPKCAI
jgi:hypothetical protein